MSRSEGPYWFWAKASGMGWSGPLVWQGWAVLAAYGALLLVSMTLLPSPFSFIASGLLTVALLYICWLKGEPLP